jgi:dTDP-4-amino-4,6-dideoxygalactose transaminase
MKIWLKYQDAFNSLAKSRKIRLPEISNYASNNAHIFYLICQSNDERTRLINHLKEDGILAVFHYISLHKSPYYTVNNSAPELVNSDLYTDCLLRLPLFYDLTNKQQNMVINSVSQFYKN